MKNLAHGLNMTMERCLCSEIFRFLSFKPKQPFLTCNWLETPQPIHSLHNYQLKINVFIHIFKFYYSLLAFLQSFLGVFFTKALYIFPRGFITVADQCGSLYQKNIGAKFTHLYRPTLCQEIVVDCHNLGHTNSGFKW